jgi:hypothetical protein
VFGPGILVEVHVSATHLKYAEFANCDPTVHVPFVPPQTDENPILH